MRSPFRLVPFCLAGLALLAETFAAAQATQPGHQPSPLTFDVVDLNAKTPVVGATITVMSSPNDKVAGTTDAGGHVVIQPQNEPTQIVCKAPGYCPVRTGAFGDHPAPADRTMRFQLEKGITIGGRVVDETMQPIAGAGVMFAVDKTYTGMHQQLDILQRVATTGRDGTWTYDGIPGDCKIRVGAFSPECLGNSGGVPLVDADLDVLRTQKWEKKLTRGVPIDLSVVGPDGQPVVARLVYGVRYIAIAFRMVMDTNEDGKIRLGIPAGSTQTMLLKKKGCAPEVVMLKVGQTPTTLRVQLKPAQTLTGKVVDTAGKPVVGADVTVERYHGTQTVGSVYGITTNAEGKFNWSEAPADAITMRVSGPGDSVTVDMTAGQDNLVTLK